MLSSAMNMNLRQACTTNGVVTPADPKTGDALLLITNRALDAIHGKVGK
jgi:hypothetical protein